ncbi:MAG TPA: hypothetical protein VE177_05380 [Candidatus Binatus sp.]|nr:hypothetical protein [Candidatus Binatus sp.]
MHEHVLSQLEQQFADRITLLLLKFPEYRKVLTMALIHEESSSPSGYSGWRWHDVEAHPTKLIRLVAEGIAKVNFKSRQGNYYLLKDLNVVRKVLRATQPRPSDMP